MRDFNSPDPHNAAYRARVPWRQAIAAGQHSLTSCPDTPLAIFGFHRSMRFRTTGGSFADSTDQLPSCFRRKGEPPNETILLTVAICVSPSPGLNLTRRLKKAAPAAVVREAKSSLDIAEKASRSNRCKRTAAKPAYPRVPGYVEV